MKQEKFSGDHEYAERNIFLLLMVTILILYIAAPLYGVIRDEKQGDAVFRIENRVSGADRSLPDKIIDFFFGSKEIPVQAIHIFDLEGTVIYTDKTPYSNGVVELMSTPRYTRTAENGYFIFRDVEAGKHTINVLDGSGNTVASCGVDISIGKSVSSRGSVSQSGGNYIIHAPVNVETLEIQLVLETGEDGSVSGISGIEVVNVVTAPPDQPQSPAEIPPGSPEQPEQPGGGIPQPPEPGTPEPPGTVPGGGPAGGGNDDGGGDGGPIPGLFHFSVYDNSVSFDSETARINIFGTDKRIAPGKQGSYRFTVDNTQNDYSSLYTVNFTVSDTLPEGSKIPVVYRLKAGNSYVAGGKDAWCDASRLYQDRVIPGNSSVVYTLEWYWPEGNYDNLYAELGKNTEFSYSLRIEVTAQQH